MAQTWVGLGEGVLVRVGLMVAVRVGVAVALSVEVGVCVPVTDGVIVLVAVVAGRTELNPQKKILPPHHSIAHLLPRGGGSLSTLV